MSTALEAAGSSTTSPESCGSDVMALPSEKVPAHEVVRVRTLHVGPGVNHHVPVPAGWRVAGVDLGPRVGDAVGIRDHPVQSEDDASRLLAAAAVDVRNVLRVRRQAVDLHLEHERLLWMSQLDGADGARAVFPAVDLEDQAERAWACA